MKALLCSAKTWIALVAILGLAGIVYWQRTPVLAWYYVRQLSYAYQENCEACAKKVAGLEEAALPRLFDGLRNPDAIVCRNLTLALTTLARNWGPDDARTQELIERVRAEFTDFSPAGQEKTLLFLTSVLHYAEPKPLPARLTSAVGDILLEAEKKDELRGVALLLAAELVDAVQPGQWVDACRGMFERGLGARSAGVRIAAVQLLLRAPLRTETELYEMAVPLLADREPAVRRAALVALASVDDVVREESLLPLLQDDDLEVQYLSELVLRKRGLTDDDVRLARMIGDANPATRMGVLHYFHQMPGLNVASWLRRLSHDPSPAVRAAAVRAAYDYPQADLTDRLREIAESDPSETVRLNARYYLSQRASRAALD